MRLTRALMALLALSSVIVDGRAQTDRRLSPGRASERRLALVIGNDRYATTPLTNAANDARAVAVALRDVGFDVSEQLNSGSEAMDRAIEAFAARVEPGDVALFYYSGHGVQVSGENYLIPIDYAGRDEIALRRRTVALSDVHERLRQRGARVSVLILDACRDNPYRAARSGTGGWAAYNAQGALVAFATAPGNTASDGTNGSGNGLFTRYLIDALRVPGLPASELFRRVRQQVSEASGGRQFPWLSDGLIGEFVFRGGSAPPIVTPPVSGGADAARREDQLWASIKDLKVVGPFEDYLTRVSRGELPGLYRAAAEARVDELLPDQRYPTGATPLASGDVELTPERLEEWLARLFAGHPKGDVTRQDYAKLLGELQGAGIRTSKALTDLIERHRSVVLAEDAKEAQRCRTKPKDSGCLQDRTNQGFYFSQLGLGRRSLVASRSK